MLKPKSELQSARTSLQNVTHWGTMSYTAREFLLLRSGHPVLLRADTPFTASCQFSTPISHPRSKHPPTGALYLAGPQVTLSQPGQNFYKSAPPPHDRRSHPPSDHCQPFRGLSPPYSHQSSSSRLVNVAHKQPLLCLLRPN